MLKKTDGASYGQTHIEELGTIIDGVDRTDKQGLGLFIDLPWHIYREEPVIGNWVPPNKKEMRTVLGIKNPFFEHADGYYALAMRHGEPVGRIAAFVDHLHNETHHERAGSFGYYEAFDDSAIPRSLFARANDWLRSRGMDIVRGPLNPSANNECGLLVEGFEYLPQIMMPFNPAYYIRHMVENGFHEAKILRSYILTQRAIAENRILEHWREHDSPRIAADAGVSVRSLRLDDIMGELDKVKEIYNTAWEPNWGFVPMTDNEISAMAESLINLIDPDLVLFAERKMEVGKPEPIGFILGVPNYNQALLHMDGKDGLVESLKFIYHGGFPANLMGGLLRKAYRGRIHDCRVMVMGVKQEHQGGPAASLLLKGFQRNMGTHYHDVDMSWTLDDNEAVNETIERLGGRVIKRHAIYAQSLGRV